MIESNIFRVNIYQDYITSFNNYVMETIYGGNVILGSDIEDEWRDVPVDD